MEATEVVEPNPISPNESTSYSNLYHCDRDGVYLYIDTVSSQLADAIGRMGNKNKRLGGFYGTKTPGRYFSESLDYLWDALIQPPRGAGHHMGEYASGGH